MTWEITDLG